jgi:hypothetical protein
MQLKNPYFYYSSAISPDICQKIITLGLSKMVVDEAKGIKKEAQTFDGKEKDGYDVQGKSSEKISTGGANKQTLQKKGINIDNAYVRDSYVSWLNDRWLYDLFHPYIHKSNTEGGWNWEWDFSESFQFTVYEGSKKQFYGWHADGSSDWPNIYKPAINVGSTKDNKIIWKPALFNKDGSLKRDGLGNAIPNMQASDIPLKNNGQLLSGFTDNKNMWGKVRKISMTVNLTKPENYSGGNLKFDFGSHVKKRFVVCNEIRPQGSIIVFPSFLYHCVTPVTRGTRYSLVLWSLGKPFK